MMKKTILLFLLLFSVSILFAQRQKDLNDHCGSDEINQKRKESNLGNLRKFEKQATSLNLNSQTYVIPLVIHVMHKGETLGVGTNISNEAIFEKIKLINKAYRNTDGTGIDMGIEFALAVRDSSGQATNGINRIDMSSYPVYMDKGVNFETSQGLSDLDLKAISVWDTSKYYNIWLVSEIDDNENGGGTYGYAYYADSHGYKDDGAVIMSSIFKNNLSTTEIHELGHAFNLLHTFEGDRINSEPACPIGDGDFCADTPPHKREFNDCSLSEINPCDGNLSELFVHNYMSYSYDSCRNQFTNDQKNRAITALTTLRSSFLTESSTINLVPVSAPVANFIPALPVVLSVGESIILSDTSENIPNTFLDSTLWPGISFDWEVSNGTNVFLSKAQNPKFTFNQKGIYTIKHTVSNEFGSNSQVVTGLLHIIDPVTENPPNTIEANYAGNYGYTIHNVSLNSIHKSTDKSINTPYSDFINSDKTALVVGNHYPLSIVFKSGNQYSEYLSIYIDYNNDGVFQETEKIGSVSLPPNTASTTATAELVIPSTAIKNTLLRMRIAGNAPLEITNDMINGLHKFDIGDVEDYGIYVVDPPENLGLSNVNNNTIVFYPNPVENILNLESKSVIEKTKIYNIMGQLLQSEKFNTTNVNLDFSGLTSGLYIVSTLIDNKNSTFKILKK